MPAKIHINIQEKKWSVIDLKKISKIAFRLQTCLDLEGDNEIAEQLNWLYRFIRYMSKRIQDNEDMNYVQPAFKVASDLKEAWDGIPEEHRNN